MAKEIDIAFALLRGALNGETPEVEPMEAKQWWNIFRLLQKNHVAALCFDTISDTKIPREVKMPWLAEHEKDVDWYRYQQNVQDDIVSVMQKHGIETLVLKGTHLAQYYPRPELREFGDLDLYFYDKHEEADKIAVKELGVMLSNNSHHHSKYDYRGVTVESHYDLINTHYPPSNRRYETLLKKLATQHPSLSTFEVLFLVRHMACHFAASRLTLRDLVDWALTCRALHNKVDWTLAQGTFRQYGMETFFNSLNTIAALRLGMQAPELSTNCQLPTTNCQLLEHDIVYGDPATDDRGADGLARLPWKLRRWCALAWKRRLVFNDSSLRLCLASLGSHSSKPQSILHKQ